MPYANLFRPFRAISSPERAKASSAGHRPALLEAIIWFIAFAKHQGCRKTKMNIFDLIR